MNSVPRTRRSALRRPMTRVQYYYRLEYQLRSTSELRLFASAAHSVAAANHVSRLYALAARHCTMSHSSPHSRDFPRRLTPEAGRRIHPGPYACDRLSLRQNTGRNSPEEPVYQVCKHFQRLLFSLPPFGLAPAINIDSRGGTLHGNCAEARFRSAFFACSRCKACDTPSRCEVAPAHPA